MIADPVDMKLLTVDEVCKRFTPLVWKLALKTRGPAELEDRVQEAYAALVHAYRWYAPGRGTKFLSIAFRIIQQDLWKLHNDRSWLIRRPVGNRSRRPGVVSMSMPVDADGTELGSLLPDRHLNDEAMRNLEADEVQHALGCIDARDAYVLLEHFGRDRTMADIAPELGVCSARVQQLSKRGLGRLTVELAKRGRPGDCIPALERLVADLLASTMETRRASELALIEAMREEGVEEYDGWQVVDRMQARVNKLRRKEANYWMRKRGRRAAGLPHMLGAWLLAQPEPPPAGLFNSVRTVGLRRA